MVRSVLDHCLLKVAEGDQSYRERLFRRLSERLLYLPCRVHNDDFDAIVIAGEKFLTIPVFTQEALARNWVSINCSKAQIQSRLGLEISNSLNKEHGLIINPGEVLSITLTPEDAKKIINFSDTTEADSWDLDEPGIPKNVVKVVPIRFAEKPHITLIAGNA